MSTRVTMDVRVGPTSAILSENMGWEYYSMYRQYIYFHLVGSTLEFHSFNSQDFSWGNPRGIRALDMRGQDLIGRDSFRCASQQNRVVWSQTIPSKRERKTEEKALPLFLSLFLGEKWKTLCCYRQKEVEEG